MELHLEAQVREWVDEALRARGGIAALEGVLAELVIGLPAGNDVIDDYQECVGERHHGFLVPASGSNAVVACCERGMFGVRGRLRRLDQDGAQPDGALARAPAALAPRTLVVAGRQPRPGGQRSGI